MELDAWRGKRLSEMFISVGRQSVGRSSLWVNTADNRIYSIQKEISTTENTVTICTTTTPVTVNAIDADGPVVETVTMTKQAYFKRKLAGEFGDL